MACKSALEQYLAFFDGANNDFARAEHLFDSLFHESFTGTTKDGTKVNRNQIKRLHAGYLSKGSEATLVSFRRIGLTCADVQFSIANEEQAVNTHLVITMFEKKIVKSWVVDESLRSRMKAKCASDFTYYWGALLTSEDILNRKKPEEHGKEFSNKGLFKWSAAPSNCKALVAR